jgi:hypothetical protein
MRGQHIDLLGYGLLVTGSHEPSTSESQRLPDTFG